MQPNDRRQSTATDRESAIAEGVGLIRAGESIREASRSVGVAYSTLHDNYMRVLGPDAPNRLEERKKADERILATAYSVAEQTLGRMSSEADQADHRTLTAWADVSSRVVGRIRGWDAKGGEGAEIAPRWLLAISNMLDQGGATLTVTLEPRSDADKPNDIG